MDLNKRITTMIMNPPLNFFVWKFSGTIFRQLSPVGLFQNLVNIQRFTRADAILFVQAIRIGWRNGLLVDVFAQHRIDLDGGEKGDGHGKIVDADFGGEQRARPQIHNLQGQSGAVSIFGSDEKANFVVDREADATANVVSVEQITHADQKQVEVVDAGRLHDPIDARTKKILTYL